MVFFALRNDIFLIFMTIDWTAIDTLLLDMDGTLLDLHFDNYFWLHYLPQAYSDTHNIDPAQAVPDLHQRFTDKRGSLSWYCLDYWSRELQLDIVALKHQLEDKIAIRPFVPEFLQQQRQAGKQLILVTNAHRASLSLKMAKTGLATQFDALVSTHDYGAPKEDPALWAALQNDYRYNPSRCLLIDDSEPILDCAAACGIGHLLTLRQPDSQQAPREGLKYPAILHFNEIMCGV